MPSLRREPFSRDREFVTRRGFLITGRTFTIGQPFDKTLATTRRLRLLYEQRFIDVVPGSASPPKSNGAEKTKPAPKVKPKVDLSGMTEEALRAWLVKHGVTPHPRANLERLQKRAERVLAEQVAGG